MKMFVVAVFDKKTGLYDPPFTCRHIGEAIRSWDVVRKDENSKIGKHPEDFDLFRVGYYYDETAQLEPSLEHIASGV